MIEWWYFAYVDDKAGQPASQQGFIGVTDEAWSNAEVQFDDLILDNDYPPMTIELCMIQDEADDQLWKCTHCKQKDSTRYFRGRMAAKTHIMQKHLGVFEESPRTGSKRLQGMLDELHRQLWCRRC